MSITEFRLALTRECDSLDIPAPTMTEFVAAMRDHIEHGTEPWLAADRLADTHI